MINYSILAGQIYIYFAIFHLSRMVIIEIGFWFFLLDRFTPFKLIKMFKCAKCVFFKMLYSPFQKRFCQIKQKKCKWLSSWIQTILYEHEAGTIFFWVMVVKSSPDSQVTQKTAEKFWIPQMTAFLISNPKGNYCY